MSEAPFPVEYALPNSDGLTPSTATQLALKIFGLYALLQVLSYLGQPFWYLFRGPGGDPILFVITLMPLAVHAAVALVCLVWTRTMSQFLLPTPDGTGERWAPARDLQAVAFSVAGAVLFVSGLSSLAGGLLLLQLRGTPGGGINDLMVREVAAPLAQVVLAACLFFGARGLSGLWHWLRTAGVHRPGGRA